MKLVTWIVALCNRKWQREFDAMVASIEMGEDLVVEENIVDIIDSQPTHLSHKFQARAKRKHSNRKPQAEVNKEEALAKIMEEELAKLAK